MSTQVRPANDINFDRLMDFVNDNHLSFLHPDWLSPRDRLLQEGCYGLLDVEDLLALISATIEVAPVAWLMAALLLVTGLAHLLLVAIGSPATGHAAPAQEGSA